MPKTSHQKAASSKRPKTKVPKRARGTVHLGLYALGALVALIIIGKAIAFINDLGQPFSPDMPTEAKKFLWEGDTRINVAVKAKDFHILSYDPTDKDLQLIKVPENTYVTAAFNTGKWPVRSLYELGQANKPSNGALLFEKSLGAAFGLDLDGYLLFPKDKIGLERTVEVIRGNPLNLLTVLSGSKTNLSFSEYWNLLWGIRGVRSDKIAVVDLERSNLTSWALLPDGSRVLELNAPRVDKFIRENFGDTKITNEGLTVRIYNATDHSQMAERAARIVTNMGGRVTFTDTTATKLEGSLVSGKESYTYQRLTQAFAPECFVKDSSSEPLFTKILKAVGIIKPPKPKCELNIADIDPGQADVNMVLGEEYFLRYNKVEAIGR